MRCFRPCILGIIGTLLLFPAISSASESAAGTLSQGPLSGMEFASIPSGSFSMGSPSGEGRGRTEEPLHTVNIQSFELMTTEVTQGMWEEVMGTTVQHQRGLSTFDLSGTGPDYPMYLLSWRDCQEFIAKMNDLYPSYTYRLPSEAEWEYACRSGTTTRFYWGNDPANSTEINQYAWYADNSNDTTHPVAQKLPNAWGLYDMSGNVFEWCQDSWHNGYTRAPTDGSPWISQSGSFPVMRGGDYYDIAGFCRSSFRTGHDPGVRSCAVGFRLSRSVSCFEVDGAIITDTTTGLEWRVGPDSDTDWYEADYWVKDLGGTWRMPSLPELQGLYIAGITRDSWGAFANSGLCVWSSSYGFTFGDEACIDRNYYYLTGNGRAFAVRSQ